MSKLKVSISVIFFVSAVSAFAADTISGQVHNQTTGKPAAGDQVTLLRLGEGMQVESRTITDAQGAFTLSVAFPQDRHLVQVSHQGVNYDQPLIGGRPLDVIVYDAVPRVPGLSGSVGAVQLASDGKLLQVTELYEILNRSDPPVTQHSFTFSLPANAVVDSAQARKQKGMWLKVTADAIKGRPGNYGINFPVRPGGTQLNLVYHLPYNGSAKLHLKVPYPTAQFGVMHPSSMTFKSIAPNAFKTVNKGDLVVELDNGAAAGYVPAFEISGMGTAHAFAVQPAPSPSAPSGSAASSNVPAAQSASPPPMDQSRKELWLMIAGIAVILCFGIAAVWRIKARRAPAIVSTNAGMHGSQLEALKEELFRLENQRLDGAISAEEYAATKRVLSHSIERAMARK